MMVSVVYFTKNGSIIAEKIAKSLTKDGDICTVESKRSASDDVARIVCPISEWASDAFEKSDALVFIGAIGIAVRSIASSVASKVTDPAVVVIDEKGRFSIPILSGHIGGANLLAKRISASIGAIPVITTATDVNGVFAADSFAVRNNMLVADLELVKIVSSKILDGEKVGFLSDYPYIGELPNPLVVETNCDVGIAITSDIRVSPFHRTLHLVPRNVFLGIGCRKMADEQDVLFLVNSVLDEAGIPKNAVSGIASIDIKHKEPAILAVCSTYGVKPRFFSKEELQATGNGFTDSEFVEANVGIGNVCERSAVAASGGGRLLIRKRALNGVTVAVALKDFTVDFKEMS